MGAHEIFFSVFESAANVVNAEDTKSMNSTSFFIFAPKVESNTMVIKYNIQMIFNLVVSLAPKAYSRLILFEISKVDGFVFAFDSLLTIYFKLCSMAINKTKAVADFVGSCHMVR